MTKKTFIKKCERAKELLELTCSNVCGSLSTQAKGGFSYSVTFTDDLSRYGYIYLMRHKSETLKKFKEFKSEIENKYIEKIKAPQSNRSGEYLS